MWVHAIPIAIQNFARTVQKVCCIMYSSGKMRFYYHFIEQTILKKMPKTALLCLGFDVMTFRILADWVPVRKLHICPIYGRGLWPIHVPYICPIWAISMGLLYPVYGFCYANEIYGSYMYMGDVWQIYERGM